MIRQYFSKASSSLIELPPSVSPFALIPVSHKYDYECFCKKQFQPAACLLNRSAELFFQGIARAYGF